MYQIEIGNKTYQAMVQKTRAEQSMGMQGKQFTGFDAMYFEFPNLSIQYFHTNNCIIPLDIIFILNNRIVKLYPMAMPDSGLTYDGVADAVLELPGGTVFKDIITLGKQIKIDKNGIIPTSASSGNIPTRAKIKKEEDKSNSRNGGKHLGKVRKQRSARAWREDRNRAHRSRIPFHSRKQTNKE